MQAIRLIILVVCVSFLTSCLQRQTERAVAYELCDRSVGRTTEGVLRFCSQINGQSVDAIQREWKPTDTEIILTSGGGGVPDGIALARFIAEKNLIVRARMFCLSACSTHVLMTAERVIVEPDTIIAFHHTAAFAIDFFADRANAAPNDPSRGPSWQEREFYKNAGLDPELLYRFGAAVEPVCRGIRQTPTGVTEREAYLNYRYAWFVPSTAEAQSLFRGRLTGYWPQSQKEAQTRLRELVGNPALSLRYGWPEQLNADTRWYAANLPTCSDSTDA